eukprot:CAMPEP_0114161436 /NCGR_PEP_ID=MMETSP0043_2-20121206/28932_1 /TAXON_ID=464988 /ORGANISM="Hemiselmis andersenii, Strain CCMP644" /LENGTH=520 /DNA_ID=CAMNT_0001257627 /DNA_START=42 /DNA_END=1601 /DNA_ORIENTATION=+
MILDKFGFITDEVAQVETADWSNGSSTGQIEELTSIYRTLANRDGYVAISILEPLLEKWPLPLGFRREDGSIQRDEADVAAVKLIKAELTVIAMREQVRLEKEQEAKKGHLQRVKKWLLSFTQEKQVFKRSISAMGFIDMVLTILYWRLPTMVPTSVKQERLALVDEVVKMAKALALTSSVNRMLAKKKKAEVSRALQRLVDFRKWARADEHMVRRMEMIDELKHRKDVLANIKPSTSSIITNSISRVMRLMGGQGAQAFKLALKEVPPFRMCMVTMTRIEQPPENTVEHIDAAKELFGDAPPKATDAIATFSEFAKKYPVVLRFLDTGHANSIGLVLCTFKGAGDWIGWKLREHKEEALLQPETRRANISSVQGITSDGKWLEIEMEIKPAREVWEQNQDLGMTPMGSLIDVHGFVVPGGLDKQGKPIHPHSEARLSLGTLAIVQQRKRELAARQNKRRAQASGPGGPTLVQQNTMSLPEDFDAVMQVVGYVRKPSDKKRDMTALKRTQSAQEERVQRM